MNAKLQDLKTRLLEINDLNSAAAVLSWDQTTNMPPGGAMARGRQLATLSRLAHERFVDPEIGRLLDDLRPYEESLPPDSDDASLIRVTRHDYEKAVKVPAAFVAQLNEHGARSYQAWIEARPANDFPKVQPYLETTLDLSRQLANFFPGYQHIIDPLIDYADQALTASTISALFGELRGQLVPLVQAITSQPGADDACLRQTFPEAQQLAFTIDVIRRLGYDFDRGRQDKSAHPFTTKFSLGDVRITTRVNEHDLGDALFSSIHEAGHALYEQGIDMQFDGTPLAGGASSGVHESQSRLWENLVGRSRGFWQFFYPQLQQRFPGQLKSVAFDTFYRAINKVQRSLIRTDADEVTYNLHIMIRFDLEMALLEGRLAVRDLPEAWHARYRSDLGITAPDDRDGVLQDVHWYGGVIGGSFQGYTLGNITSAQVFEAALTAQPDIPAQITQGNFETLRSWLTEHLYRYGNKLTAPELIQRATGQPLSIAPYLKYLRSKYGELYQL
jgi:carboxypeptidase Taq